MEDGRDAKDVQIEELTRENAVVKKQRDRYQQELQNERTQLKAGIVAKPSDLLHDQTLMNQATSIGRVAGAGVLKDASKDVIERQKSPGLDADSLATLEEAKWLGEHQDCELLQEINMGIFEGSIGLKRDKWDGDTKLRVVHAMYMILSTHLAVSNYKWVSPLMTMFMYVLLSMTKCPTLGFVCAGLFFGCITPVTIWNWIELAVKDMVVEIDDNTELFLEIDNWGFYRRKQARSSIANRKEHPIICNGILFAMTQSGKLTYQRQLKYNPMNKGEITPGTDVDAAGYIGPTYGIPKALPDNYCQPSVFSDIKDAPEHIESAVSYHAKGLARDIFVEVWHEALKEAPTFTDVGSVSNRFINSDSQDETKVQVKVCRICAWTNDKSSRTCYCCKELLDSIEVYRAEAKAAQSSGDPERDMYLQWKAREKIEMDTVQVTHERVGEGVSSRIVVKKERIEDPDCVFETPMIRGGDIGKDIMEVTMLPCMPYNPAGYINLKKLLDLYGDMVGLEGFCVRATPGIFDIRPQYVLWGTDQGAYNKKLANEGKYQRFLPVPCTFHCEVAYMRALNSIMIQYMGDSFYKVCGWPSLQQRKYMLSGADVHKTLATINNTHKAHIRALINPWLKKLITALGGVNELKKMDPVTTFDLFWTYIHSEEFIQNDTQIKHLLFFFVDEVIPALLLIHCAQRLCKFWYYMAASLLLMPIFYVRNNIKYGPYLVEDCALWLHLVPPVIRGQRVTFFTHQGQSHGAILEQGNKKMKKTIMRESSHAFKAGSGGMEQLSVLEAKLYEIARVKRKETAPHCEISYVADVDAIEDLIVKGKAYVVVPNRPVGNIRTCDGSELLGSKDSNSVSMYAIAKQRHFDASQCYKNGTKYKWESPIPISEKEQKDGVIAVEDEPNVDELHSGGGHDDDEQVAAVLI